MSMTFADFKLLVKDHITVDGARYGVSLGSAKYLDRQVTDALLDLQSFIPALREGHKEVLKPFDVLEDGEANTGTMPEGVVSDAYYVTKTCHCIRRPFVPYPWEHRFDLFCGKPRIPGWQYFFAVSPFADQFVIYPKLTSTAELWLYWSGTKGDWDDGDTVKYGEEEAEAVGFFAKSRICREVDKDLVLAQSYWVSYAGAPGVMGLRSRLFSDWKQRSKAPASSTSPQPEKMRGGCDCTTLTCCWAGGDCGFFEGFLYLIGPDELWHKITITGAVGSEAFVIGAGIAEPAWDACVTAEAEGYRFGGGWFHILNTLTDEWVSISFTGSGEEASVVFGPEKGELASISTAAVGYKMDPCLLIKNTETGEYCPLNLLDAP